MKKIKYTQAEADEILFSAMKEEIEAKKDDHHIERLKFQVYNADSLLTLIDWFMNSEANDIEIEFNYDIINRISELIAEKIKDTTVNMTLKTQEVRNGNFERIMQLIIYKNMKGE